MVNPLQDQQFKPAGTTGCPHLGIQSDETTRFGYPSMENYCHKINPAEKVSLAYQSSVCLTPAYHQCSIYVEDGKKRLPKEIRVENASQPPWKRLLVFVFAAIFIFVIVIAFLSFRNKQGLLQTGEIRLPQPSQVLTALPTKTSLGTQVEIRSTAKPTFAEESSSAPTKSLQPTFEPSITPTLFTTPSATSKIPTPGPLLETPFGVNNSYLIHQIHAGESLLWVASQYETTVEVILGLNEVLLLYGFQPDQNIVIMPGQTDDSKVETLSLMFLEVDVEISDFALEHGVSEDELRDYNDLGFEETIPGGRWFIYPKREINATPTFTPIIEVDLRLALTEPFGPDQAYILHKVMPGESVPFIESLYLTSSEVIRKANRIEGSVRPDQILVIIINQTDPSGVPLFGVIYISDEISVDDQAMQLGVQASDLIYYNSLESDELITPGGWIIYPTR